MDNEKKCTGPKWTPTSSTKFEGAESKMYQCKCLILYFVFSAILLNFSSLH